MKTARPITHARGTAAAIRGKRVGAIFATAQRVTKGTHTWSLVAKVLEFIFRVVQCIFTLGFILFLFDFTDINECENSILNKCENPETCVNTQGNYTCSCPMWYQGDGKIDGQRCIPNRLQMIHAAMGQCTYYLLIILSQPI